jgi:hypothetical protein
MVGGGGGEGFFVWEGAGLKICPPTSKRRVHARPARGVQELQVVVGVKEAEEAASVSLAPQLALPKVPRVAAFQLKSCIAARHDVEREQAAIVDSSSRPLLQ